MIKLIGVKKSVYSRGEEYKNIDVQCVEHLADMVLALLLNDSDVVDTYKLICVSLQRQKDKYWLNQNLDLVHALNNFNSGFNT